MTSFQARIAKIVMQVQPYNWAKGTIAEQRARQENSTRFLKLQDDTLCQPVKINQIPAEWISCTRSNKGVILYLHGGAYTLGSINVHREFLTRLACATECKILAINYRLAPEHAFPAALEDSLEAYRWLLQQGFNPSQIIIAGDSAGGGLAVSTLVSLRDAGDPLPITAICFSPWLDLSLSGNSIQENAKSDPILNAALLNNYARYYCAGKETTTPLISPLYANLEGLPPIMLQVGSDEILLDDSVRFTEVAHKAGVDVTLKVWEGMFHVFQIVPFLPETPKAINQVAEFLKDTN